MPPGERCLGTTIGRRETGTSAAYQLVDLGDGHYEAAGVPHAFQGT